MLRKKLLSLASAGALTTALCVSAFAGGPTAEPMMSTAHAESGFTLGANYATYLDNNFVLMAGYVNDDFLVDFGANYNQYNKTALRLNMWELRGDLGLRSALNDTLFATYGVNGGYGILSNANSATKSPWAAGAFVGLDYQPINHLLLSFKIDPYMYVSDPTNNTGTGAFTTANEIFSNGSIGAAYIFS